MDITVNIDVDTLMASDIEEMEDATKMKEMHAWLKAHAGITDEDWKKIKYKDVPVIFRQVGEQLKAAVEIPKGSNGSSSPA